MINVTGSTVTLDQWHPHIIVKWWDEGTRLLQCRTMKDAWQFECATFKKVPTRYIEVWEDGVLLYIYRVSAGKQVEEFDVAPVYVANE